MHRLRLLAAAAAALALTGCAGAVSLPAAEDAADPSCATVVLSLPEQLGDQTGNAPLERRDTTAQGTAAWGDPSAVTLRCGMPEPAPSAERCIAVGDVDWLTIAQEDDVWTLVSYGRSPATEVVIDTTAVATITALEAISPAVERTDRVGACT